MIKDLSRAAAARHAACGQCHGPGHAGSETFGGPDANPNIGKPLFDTHCASCHGADLEGSDKGPPMLHKVYQPSHHSDMAFQMAVKNGSRAHHWNFGDMKPVEGVTADEVAHITAYVRMQQRKAGIR